MLRLKVKKVGSSLVIIIPTEAVRALKVEEGSTLFLTEAPDGYRVSPYDPDLAKTMEVAEGFMRRYRNALQALAR